MVKGELDWNFWIHIHCFKFKIFVSNISELFIYLTRYLMANMAKYLPCLQFSMPTGKFRSVSSSETRTPSPWPVVPCWLSVELTYELVIWMPLGVEMDGPSHWKWVDSIWISSPGWKFEIDGVVRCIANRGLALPFAKLSVKPHARIRVWCIM